jgi:hypothetical protein
LEQALSIKGLRLVTISISIVLISVLGTLAYSGYQEVTYVTQSLGQQGIGQLVVMNATYFSISGLNLENRGVYPLTLALEGNFSLDGVSLGSKTFGPLTIPPGSQSKINFSLPIQIGSALNNPLLIRRVLFNGTLASLRLKITIGLQPILIGTISGGKNNTMGAVLDGFNLRVGNFQPYNETHIKIPVTVEFTNKSPMLFDATLSALIVSSPLQPTLGNYGSGSMVISSSFGQHYEGPLSIYLSKNAVGRGLYVVELSLISRDFTYSWNVPLEG